MRLFRQFHDGVLRSSPCLAERLRNTRQYLLRPSEGATMLR
jgi:hypothetical protein